MKNNNKKGEKMKTNIGKTMIGKACIVRANTAGVHAGIVKEISGTTVVLKDAYRLWRFYTREKSGSISDIAANGLKPDAQHMIGAKLNSVLIENPQGLEVAEMTKDAYKSLADWKNK